jgi:tRNA (guanine26-N2/guanine27-N2)-dimethyltransferase
VAGPVVVREGRALLWIPDPSTAIAGSRLEPAWLPVFYNPVMEFNRDFSVAALQAYIDLYAPHKPITLVEPLTATGVRSVRYALEVEGVGRVIAGDIDPEAVRYARRNAESNGVSGTVEVRRGDASALLHRLAREEGEPILAVDLDPFGSPAPFMDAALAAVGHRGLLAATATDLAVLEGSKRRAALRRYQARLQRIPQAKEVAVRTLIGYAARLAAARDKAVRPLAAYWADHYVRVYLLVERGARRADRMLEECVGHAYWCEGLGHVEIAGCPEPSRGRVLGPLWTCETGDPEFLERVAALASGRLAEYAATASRVERLASRLLREAPLTRGKFYFELWALAASMKANTPSRRRMLDMLHELGWDAVETHYSPSGVRSRAPLTLARSLVGLLHRRP